MMYCRISSDSSATWILTALCMGATGEFQFGAKALRNGQPIAARLPMTWARVIQRDPGHERRLSRRDWSGADE